MSGRNDQLAAELAAAAFVDDARIVVSGDPDAEPFDAGDEDPSHLRPGELGCWDIRERRWLSRTSLGVPTGPLMALEESVVTFFEHRRLRDIATGKVLSEWPELPTGNQRGSIFRGETTPPMALDGMNRRFAIADDKGITVIQLGD